MRENAPMCNRITAYGRRISPTRGRRIFVRPLPIHHLYIKALCEKQEDALQKTEQLLECNPDVILIMDEVGSGIIPMEKSERQWREAVGRVSCFLARRAESVERIVCGCGVKIK